MTKPLIIIILFFTICGCRKDTTKWNFEIRNSASQVDAHHIETSFSPNRFNVTVKGYLSDSARFIHNIYSSGSTEMSSQSIRLDSGKVDISFGGDIYEKNLDFIYIPSNELKTSGKLSVSVTME